jgi:hypothetical protein
MGFIERANIPANFNDAESWKETVTACCHCWKFLAERPLKKKLLKCASHHDDGLPEPFRCQSLWVVRPVGKTREKKKAIADAVENVIDSEESIVVTQNGRSAKKQKKLPAPSNVAVNLPVGVTGEVARATGTRVPHVDAEVIENLEVKLRAKYDHDLAHYLQENSKLQDLLAVEKANSRDIGHLQQENAALKRENRGLVSENASVAAKNASVAAENTSVLAEVMEERQRIRKQVLALDVKKARSSSRSFVESLEDCTKEAMSKGMNKKYQAEMLADSV